VEAGASPVTLFCRLGLVVGPPVDFDWRLNLQVLKIVFKKDARSGLRATSAWAKPTSEAMMAGT
jgi:hypothetical protein